MEVKHAAAVVGEDEEDEENLVLDGRHDEEVAGDHLGGVGPEENHPGGVGGSSAANHVLLDGRFGHVDADLPQLADDPGCSPQRVGRRQPPDENAHFFGHLRPSRFPRTAKTGPVIAEPPALPGDDGSRLHDHEGLPPPGPEAGEPGPEEAVGGPESRPPHRSLADGQLMAEREDLKLHRGAGTDGSAEERKESKEDRSHESLGLLCPVGRAGSRVGVSLREGA